MKKKWRSEILNRRNQLQPEAITEKSMAILENLKAFEEALAGKTAMIFIDFGKEVRTRPLIDYLKTLDCRVVIPRVDLEQKTMQLYPYTSHEDLEPSGFGILEPVENPALILSPLSLEVVITPGVVFDLMGYRIGYGGGFYDRLFAVTGDKVLKIAIGFDLQVVEEVPRDRYDLPVDHLITESRILTFKK
jgi:5-formyltetrahydrofolate cyclo-ligase